MKHWTPLPDTFVPVEKPTPRARPRPVHWLDMLLMLVISAPRMD